MFDTIKRWFGEGHIYAEFKCEDGTSGRLKAPYIGDPETLDNEEFLEHIKNEIWFKHGKRVTEVTDIRFS